VPPPDPATFDLGNPLLDPSGIGPIALSATLMTSPATGAQHVIVTCHTSQGTMWGKMTRDQAGAAIEILTAKRDKISALIVPGAGPDGGRM
jgi:hypothetical protein